MISTDKDTNHLKPFSFFNDQKKKMIKVKDQDTIEHKKQEIKKMKQLN